MNLADKLWYYRCTVWNNAVLNVTVCSWPIINQSELASLNIHVIPTQQISGVEKSGVRQKSVKELDFWSLFFNSDYSLCYGILPGCVLFWSSLIGVQERVLTFLELNVEKCATTLVLQHKRLILRTELGKNAFLYTYIEKYYFKMFDIFWQKHVLS